MTLHCMGCTKQAELMSLRAKVNNYESGKACQRDQEQIAALSARLEKARADVKKYLDLLRKAQEENRQDRRLIRNLEKELTASQNEIQLIRKQMTETELALMNERKENEELKKTVDELQRQAELLKKLAHTADGTNSGIPTRRTPIGKAKVIPATERNTGNPIGGVVGHEPHFAEQFDENDPTVNVVQHIPITLCPCCGKPMKQIRTIRKSEADIEVALRRTLHLFEEYECEDCGETVHEEIPQRLSGPMNYGTNIQAVMLELMEKCNVTMEGASDFIGFLVNQEIHPCAGYAAKLPVRAAAGLKSFSEELTIAALAQSLLYWDDTVISVMKHQACFRFYGTETLSLYKAHWTKAKETIEKDGILAFLDSFVFVMHDHCSASYNTDFVFMNLECVVHLIRTLNGLSDISKHKWLAEILKITRKAIHDRKKAIQAGRKSFGSSYLKKFWKDYRATIRLGYLETSQDQKSYYHEEERALLVRLQNYAANYYAWLVCFDLPVSDNLSERNLRFVKSKLSIAGQFRTMDSAEEYALIQTYIKTCEKNGIDLMEALRRVFEGNPYTVEEVLTGDDLDRYLKYKEKLLSGKVVKTSGPVEQTVFSNTELVKEEYLNLVYEFMSEPHTAEELVEILSARGKVKSLFKTDDVDKYTPNPEELVTIVVEMKEESKPEADKTEDTKEKMKPMDPIRRRKKKANGRPRKSPPMNAASAAPPG